jgi:hypothetical protein
MANVIQMPKRMPTTEIERTEEALELIASIQSKFSELTSWELQIVQDIKEGKAATNIRLRELREAVKRILNAKTPQAQ